LRWNKPPWLPRLPWLRPLNKPPWLPQLPRPPWLPQLPHALACDSMPTRTTSIAANPSVI
jgi:hypothetical protein